MIRLLMTCAVLLIAWCCVAKDVKAIQPANPLSTCAQFANKRYHANNAKNFEKITLSPQNIVVEKLEGKMGSQYINKVVSGNGVLKLKKAEPLQIEFTCLLENDRKTVFFHANPKPSLKTAKTPLQQCEGQPEKQILPCLQKALKQQEQKLIQLEKQVTSQGNHHDKQLLGVSVAQWKRYRDAECLRRTAFLEENHSNITEFECRLDKTQERIDDLSLKD